MITDKINSLNPMQKKAVLKTEGPLLILAGAGSGKTRVLTHRIAYLIDALNVRAFNILAITFTNKAAREMKERVEAITESGKDVWVSTFHSTCVRILRRDIERLGYNNHFTIYDTNDSENLMKEIVKALQVDDKMFAPKKVLAEIGRLKDELISPQGAYENASNFREQKIAELYDLYQGRLKANNALDFDDLIFKTVELFARHKDILEKYQNRFQYIMVDEYQDTNTSQYQLIRLLSAKNNNLCVVGDDDQSIYGWRGANIRNILDFEKDFANAEVIKLEQNYRSTKVILDAANNVIKNNYGRKNKKLWTENNEGDKIKFRQLRSDLEEAAFIADEIQELVRDKKAKYGDFAILYRSNFLSRVIEERFVRSSVPYRLVGGQNFYGRKEIKDVLAYIRVIYNPDDDVSIKRIINVPKRGIGDASVEKVVAYAQRNNISFYTALSEASEITELKSRTKKFVDFFSLITELSDLANELSVSKLIDTVLKKSGYIDALNLEATDEAKNRKENIQELVNKAIEYENSDEDASLVGFLEEISLVADIDSMDDGNDGVVLMTLHSSKGLEFPYVFLAGFEEGIFPSYMSTFENPDGLEEERRLCYVGITRAKKQLYITCAKSRLQHGEIKYNIPSKFLKEIPSEYLDKEGNAVKKENTAATEQKLGSYKPKPAYVGTHNSYKANPIPAPKNVKLDFEVGDKVRQMKYGIGVVKAINPAGADFEVTVEFEKAGVKKLMAMLARLKKVE